ncbi:MAG: hypothetical protein R3213_10985 [Flavobacteriaceae bacterium]|nr:hypothetical protein [Flavobacteriaceae bacterium]
MLQKIIGWLNKVEYLDAKSDINLSYCHYKYGKQLPWDKVNPQIVLFKAKGCKLCDEIDIWLDLAWIPYTTIEIKQSIPATLPKRRDLSGYRMHDCKNPETKEKFKLCVFSGTPQIELIWQDEDGRLKFETIIGDTRQMRKKIDDFLVEHSKHFPGFENGVYQDRDREMEKVQEAFRTAKEQEDGESN